MSKNLQIIEKTAQITAQLTANEIVSELKRQSLLKNNKQTPFQKTETLLYNYNHFQDAITDKYKQIEEIESVGLPKKSKSITSFSPSPTYTIKSDDDKAEEKIEAIEQSIRTTRNFIQVIDDAIDKLKDDPYFDLIRLRYFEGESREKIAEYFNVDASTISRNKNRLVNLLQIRLFSDEVICQIFS
jgi:RNA polymerase sigma factor (sigma-70 family)